MVYVEDADPTAEGPSRVTYVSGAVERILGYTVDEWLADPIGWVDRIHPDDLPALRRAYGSVIPTGAPFAADYRMFAKDGRIVWIHDEAVLVRDDDGAPVCWQGVMLDVSAQRQAHREEAAELRALDELKNTFLQAVSHDLRTPLAAILGLAVTLEQQEGPEGAEARQLASRIAANARRLDRMVTNLLDLDRITHGIVEPNLKRTDLAALVRRVVAETEIEADRPVGIETRRVVVSVDPAKVERIVENLLSNAVRHTPPAAQVWVRVGPEADGALLVVEDDGPGVAPEHRADIFQPFRQGAGAPDHSPGVGIGLALVARFAELHGGRAWVEDREGGGASFRVWLPTGRPTDDPS
jgi:PAS domain S-box-containing protein